MFETQARPKATLVYRDGKFVTRLGPYISGEEGGHSLILWEAQNPTPEGVDEQTVTEVLCFCGQWLECVDLENPCPSCRRVFGIGGGHRRYRLSTEEQRQRVEQSRRRELQQAFSGFLDRFRNSYVYFAHPISGSVRQRFSELAVQRDPELRSLESEAVMELMPAVHDELTALAAEIAAEEEKLKRSVERKKQRLERRLAKAVEAQVDRILGAVQAEPETLRFASPELNSARRWEENEL